MRTIQLKEDFLRLPLTIIVFSLYQSCERDKKALRCEVGDLEHKHSSLAVAGRRVDIATTRRFFSDGNLPLTGPASIIGHSVVVHDDKAPEHRGNRMACTSIRRQYRHKEHTNPSLLLTRGRLFNKYKLLKHFIIFILNPMTDLPAISMSV